MKKVICVSNQKGGVGKTTTTNVLACVMKHQGLRVLCIDFDPQGNLSFSLRADNREELQTSIYHVLKGELKASQAIQHTAIADIIPANILLSAIELEFTGKGREFLLRDVLRPLYDFYDYILIDSPPALGILTVNAFTVADAIIVPVLSDLFSLQGIVQLHDTVERVKRGSNPRVKIEGVLLTRFNPREQLSAVIRDTAGMIAEKLEIPLLKSFIHTSVVLTKAQVLQKDILAYAPRNQAVSDYKALWKELQERGL